MSAMSRRDFLKASAVGAAAGLWMPSRLLAADAKERVAVWVVEGTDLPAMVARGIAEAGGWKTFVRAGKGAVIKPNVAFNSGPEQGANTHPALVRAVIEGCRAAGASQVLIPENPLADFEEICAKSGIGEAARKAGAELRLLNKAGQFREVTIPQGRKLKRAAVAIDVLDADCLVNMPVAKHHGGATLSLGMKNWMGSVQDRGFWHRNDLHQCIADFSTFLKPTLVLADATRIMTTNGPRGPGKIERPNQIVIGRDPVAVDAYCATLFGKKPFDIGYIRIAHEMGVGVGDLDQVNVVRIKV